MRKKLKPGQDLDSVQSDLIETVCYNYKNCQNRWSYLQ